jgi:hypothetical protein
MFKSLAFILIIVFFSSCGVDTSSGDKSAASSYDDDNSSSFDGVGGGYTIDPKPIIVDDVNSTDDANSSDGGDSSDGGGSSGGGDTSGDIDSIFDTEGAIEDEFACMVGDPNDGYTDNSLADTSFDNQGEEDAEYGIGINSRFAYNDDITKTEVRVYYHSLKPTRTMDIVSVYESNYRVDVDTAWADNDERVIYVRTPKDENDLYGCYRYDLSFVDTDITSLVGTKVYRREI